MKAPGIETCMAKSGNVGARYLSINWEITYHEILWLQCNAILHTNAYDYSLLFAWDPSNHITYTHS